MTDALVFSLTGAEAEGSDIPAAVPMEMSFYDEILMIRDEN
jgi:hypothetical protein